MRKKIITLLLLVAVIASATISARSLATVSLGFGAAYYPSEESGFFGPGIKEAKNWRFHGELTARFFIFQAQTLVFPVQCENDRQGVLMVGMGSLSLPIFRSFLSLELGGGVGMTYVPATSEEDPSYYVGVGKQQLPTKDASFKSGLGQSPIYLQAGLASELGPIGIRVRYLVETRASLHSIIKMKEWWEVFNAESGALSLVLSLRMF